MIYGANETTILTKATNLEQQCTGVGKKKQIACFDDTILKLDLSVYEKMVYVVLCSHAEQSDFCCPSINTIAEDCSCSSRQVLRALKNLEQRKIISRESQFYDVGSKSQAANRYTIHLDMATEANV